MSITLRNRHLVKVSTSLLPLLTSEEDIITIHVLSNGCDGTILSSYPCAYDIVCKRLRYIKISAIIIVRINEEICRVFRPQHVAYYDIKVCVLSMVQVIDGTGFPELIFITELRYLTSL